MRTLPILLLACLSAGLVHAQDGELSGPEKEYLLARTRITTPPYGLAKVEALINKIKDDPDNPDDYTNGLVPDVYQKLSVREKFTYNMIYPESHWQNCDIIPVIPDEHKKIVAQLPDAFDESGWSERQANFFGNNRDSVIALMSESIERAGYVGLNYKNVIVQINATSMIPLLIRTYNKKKTDHDILTVFLLLMRENKYPPFMNSLSNKKLYEEKETSRRTWLVFNPENEALILQRITEFYNGLGH